MHRPAWAARAADATRASWARWQVTAESLAALVLSCVTLAWLAHRSQQTFLGQAVDQAGMDVVVGDATATRRLVGWLGTVSIGSVALAVAVLLGVAIVRRKYAAATAAVVMVAGANLTSQFLKRAVERDDLGYLTVSSFPSGHATVIVSVSLAAFLVTPTSMRAAVSALATGLITITAGAMLVASWHRPSDIVGAILVALAWGCGTTAVWSLVRGGVPHPGPHPHRAFSTVGVVAASAVLLVVGVRPESGWTRVLDAGLVIASIGLVAAAAVSIFSHISAPLALGTSGGGRATQATETATPSAEHHSSSPEWAVPGSASGDVSLVRRSQQHHGGN